MLATSLRTMSAKKIVAIYAQRMQIEETFRDTKSLRFGFALSHARTASPNRASVLVMLAAFAHLFAMLLGIAAEKLKIARHFQANTTRHRRINSLASLGRLVTQTPQILELVLHHVCWRALRTAA